MKTSYIAPCIEMVAVATGQLMAAASQTVQRKYWRYGTVGTEEMGYAYKNDFSGMWTTELQAVQDVEDNGPNSTSNGQNLWDEEW